MVPKIGLKTWNIYYKGKDKINFDTLEVMSSDINIGFSRNKLTKAKNFLKNIDVSMHTQTKRLFTSANPDLILMELNILKKEIIACKILGIKELIVHLKQEKLNKKEEKMFKEIIDFAKKRNVEIIYESNNTFYGETAINILKKFPKLKYNLDLGHLNTAIGNKTLGFELEEFISLVKDRIIYLHAHNNDGKKDEHKSLDSGTLDWKNVLDMIDFKKVRKIIIEVKT